MDNARYMDEAIISAAKSLVDCYTELSGQQFLDRVLPEAGPLIALKRQEKIMMLQYCHNVAMQNLVEAVEAVSTCPKQNPLKKRRKSRTACARKT